MQRLSEHKGQVVLARQAEDSAVTLSWSLRDGLRLLYVQCRVHDDRQNFNFLFRLR